MSGVRTTDDLSEGGVLDGLVVGSEPAVVLPLAFLPTGYLELLDEDSRVLTDPVVLPAAGAGAESEAAHGLHGAEESAWLSASTRYQIETTTGVVGSSTTKRWVSHFASGDRSSEWLSGTCRTPIRAVHSASIAGQWEARPLCRTAARLSPTSGPTMGWVPKTITRMPRPRVRAQSGRRAAARRPRSPPMPASRTRRASGVRSRPHRARERETARATANSADADASSCWSSDAA